MARILMERSGEMEVFAQVVRDGAFSAAARNLDLTPSAVSKLIARLETRLGARLLERTTRALRLTEEGEAYHRAAVRILRDMSDVEHAVAGGAVRGHLRVNAAVPFGSLFVAPAVASFLETHPDVSVDLSLTDDVIDLLAQKADVAIRMGTLSDSSLMARKLGEFRRVVCAAPSYLARRGTPKTPAELADHDCIRFNFRRARISWPFREGGRDFEQPITGNVLVNNGETYRQMALAGVGIARVGAFHTAEPVKRGELLPLLEKYNPGDVEMVHAIYIGGGQVPRRVRAFIDHLVDCVARSPIFSRDDRAAARASMKMRTR